MSETLPRARDIACRLLDWETATHGPTAPAEGAELAAVRTFEKVRLHMSRLVGVSGYQTLLARARAMARQEAPWLASVRINEDGTIDGLAEVTHNLQAEEISEGNLALLSSLVALLIRLVGEEMTVRIFSDIWDGIDTEFPREDAEERAE